MFEYAFDLKEEGEIIREAVNASIAAKIVTEDIAGSGRVYGTSEVGDWIRDYVR
jgi:3-isopropylmalate dehydrogenase